MVILDFFGMPGSGKSTISHELAEKLRKKGNIVEEPTWNLDMKYSKIKRRILKSWLSFSYSLRHFREIKNVFSLIGNCSTSKTDKIKMWVNLSYTMNVINRKSTADIRILDEGIAQAVLSLYMRSNSRTYEECFQILNRMADKEVKYIYINTDIDKALQRLRSRTNGKSRVDKVTGAKKMKMLMKTYELCETLRYGAKIIDNNANLSEVDFDNLIQFITVYKK
ncbi:MAG TPA: hypothetical protein VJ958_04625 [Atribacterota bacterium]|nr:hypothetical protein [Atribacterota bacterium]